MKEKQEEQRQRWSEWGDAVPFFWKVQDAFVHYSATGNNRDRSVPRTHKGASWYQMFTLHINTSLPILNTADSVGVNGKHTRANITVMSSLSLPLSLCILVCFAAGLWLSVSPYLSVYLAVSPGLMRSYHTPLYTVARFRPFVLWLLLSALFTRLWGLRVVPTNS